MVLPTDIAKELIRFKRLVRKHPVIAIIALAATCGALLVSIPPVREVVFVEALGFLRPAETIHIDSPMEGAAVSEEQSITGAGLNQTGFYYPAVTVGTTGVIYIAGSEISVQRDGSWAGEARFGDTTTPPGTRFRLRIVRAANRLDQGRLDDQQITWRSRPVEVQRR